MRFIDRKRTFYILIAANIILLNLLYFAFTNQTSSHPSTYTIPAMLLILLYITDTFFVWFAFIKDSKIKTYYLVFPIAQFIMIAFFWI